MCLLCVCVCVAIVVFIVLRCNCNLPHWWVCGWAPSFNYPALTAGCMPDLLLATFSGGSLCFSPPLSLSLALSCGRCHFLAVCSKASLQYKSPCVWAVFVCMRVHQLNCQTTWKKREKKTHTHTYIRQLRHLVLVSLRLWIGPSELGNCSNYYYNILVKWAKGRSQPNCSSGQSLYTHTYTYKRCQGLAQCGRSSLTEWATRRIFNGFAA